MARSNAGLARCLPGSADAPRVAVEPLDRAGRARARRDAPLRSTAATTLTRAARIGATDAPRRAALARAEGATDARATEAAEAEMQDIVVWSVIRALRWVGRAECARAVCRPRPRVAAWKRAREKLYPNPVARSWHGAPRRDRARDPRTTVWETPTRRAKDA